MKITVDEQDLEELIVRAVQLGLEFYEKKQVERKPPEKMTKSQLAQYWGCSIATIDRYMQNDMPYEKIGNGHPSFYLEEVAQWRKLRGHKNGGLQTV